MTIFLGGLVGGLVGWLCGHGLTDLLMYLTHKEDCDTDGMGVTALGSAVTVAATIILVGLGAVVAAYTGLAIALYVTLGGLVVLAIAIILGVFVLLEETGKVALFIYRLPVTLFTILVGSLLFCYNYACNKIKG